MRLALVPILLAPLASLASAAALGAPAICFPLEIGDARTLPAPEDRAAALPVASVASATLAVLDASDATLVHMETLRRAVLRLTAQKDEGREAARALVARLHGRVETELGRSEPRPRALGLAWFDLGYALSTFEQAGLRLEDGNVAALARAAELCPEDGPLHLGAALASWTREGGEALRKRSFRRAAELSTDPDGLLRANLMVFARNFLHARTYDELLAQVRG